MTAQSKIVEINRSSGDPAPTEQSLDDDVGTVDPLATEAVAEEYYDPAWDETPTPARPWGKILLAAFLTIAVAGWTGFFIWAHFQEIRALPAPTGISQLIVEWSAPVAVIALIWLLALRMSSAEAKPFSMPPMTRW